MAAVACAGSPDSRAMEQATALSVEVRRALTHAPSVDALWSAALLDLLSNGNDPTTIDRVVARLIEVHSRDTTNAMALNDLAIAHLVRASMRDDARDLFSAVDFVERAFQHDSGSPTVRFNRAVILERARIDDQAAVAWQQAAAVAGDGWATEARDRQRRLTSGAVGSRVSLAALDTAGTSDSTALLSLVRRDPQTAREHVVDSVTVRWSRTVVAGDRSASAVVAGRAAALGRALLVVNGDSTVPHVALELERAARSPASQHAVAAAIRLGASGAAAYRQQRYVDADTSLRAASIQLRRAGAPMLADWTDLLVAGVEIQRANYAAAEGIFTAIARRARRRQAIALEARALWGRALSQGRRGATAETESSYRVALENFARLGETSNFGFLQALSADIHYALGRSADHARAMFTALDAYRRRPDPPQRYTVLLAIGQRLADLGMEHAAVGAIREAVSTAHATGRAKDVPESRARLAYAEARLGQIQSAKKSIESARAELSAVTDPIMRSRLDAEVARAEAAVFRDTEPRRGLEQLDRVTEYFDRVDIPVDHAPALAARADVKLALGDTVGAVADLDRATTVIATLLSRDADRETIRRLVGTQSDVYRRLVAISLARNDSTAAHRYAELSRLDTILPRGRRLDHEWPAAADRATVAYLQLDDRLLIWTARPGAERPELTTVSVDGRTLEQLAMRFVNVIREEADPASEAELGRRLSELLIAPIRHHLPGVGRLVLITDERIGEIPFAALRMPNGRYLIEDVALTYAPRSAITRPRAERRREGGTSALLVSDPPWDASLFPDLERLRNAASEVEDVRQLHHNAMVLSGPGASRRALLRELPRHDLVHFAGHARVSREEPGSSHLVLSADPVGFAENVVFASEIARLDLRRVRLVVLSACGDTRDRLVARAGNGLVQAFLDAGAGAVIASQWEADDAGTAVLMRRLHAELSAGVAGDEALRRAQRAFLADRVQAGLGSSGVRIWGAFRFTVN